MRIYFDLFKESFLFAINALVVNKLRTFLSLLGITIGIFAIISVFTIVDSLEKNLRDSIKSLGDDVVFIEKWPWSFEDDYAWWKYMSRPIADYSELDEIDRKCKSASATAFVISGRRTIKYLSNRIEGVKIICASHKYDKVQNFDIADGRYFTEQESQAGRPVAIIGDLIANSLFPNQSPIGKSIKIGGAKVLIIGVFKKEGESILTDSNDSQVLVPINYARSLVNIKNESVNPRILVKAKEGISKEQLIDELTGIMRSIRRIKPASENNFALNYTSILSQGFDDLFGVVGAAGWVIGGFSILVGGFGIANIMFVSVRERTNIIGIQKSLGAKNYFILFQFLSESVVLSLIGGLIGLIIIFIGTLIIGDLNGMVVSLSRSNIILGLTISFLIGVISGFIPAYGASQMDPVEAIRTN